MPENRAQPQLQGSERARFEKVMANGTSMERVAAREPYLFEVVVGHHRRPECLRRPWEWCRAIGGHPGRCAACPFPEEALDAS